MLPVLKVRPHTDALVRQNHYLGNEQIELERCTSRTGCHQ
jgi:hypothetical protein